MYCKVIAVELRWSRRTHIFEVTEDLGMPRILLYNHLNLLMMQ